MKRDCSLFLSIEICDKERMIDLSKLSPEEYHLLVSVPYRVGVWISFCDENKKSKLDDKIENKALEGMIATMAAMHRKMPFASLVMKEIRLQSALWSTWQGQAEEAHVLEDTHKALVLCRTKAAKGDVAQYKHAVWQTALAVAQAHGEHVDPDNEMHVDRFFAWLSSFISAPKLAKAPENISRDEKIALKKLHALLKE